jgi:uncharacterized protein (TIGR00369 family)
VTEDSPDDYAVSPIGKHLGLQVRHVDTDAERIEVSFEVREEFLNFNGAVQGGILAAMLDATMGPVLRAVTTADARPVTADLHVRYFSPTGLGTLTGRGRVDRRGATIAFVSAELTDATDAVVATASSTCVLRRPRSAP